MLAEHDGTTFEFELAFSAEVRLSYWKRTDGSTLETGVPMMMSAAGTRGGLIGSRATGGLSLAFKADALWVGAASDLLDGPTGRLNASEAGVTQVRAALQGLRGLSSAAAGCR